MIRVTIESPYAGGVEANVAYAKRCVCDCLRRGESPYASHLFFTQPGLLDDLKPEERRLGIEAGLAWQRSSDVVAVYVDRGISEGMRQGIAAAAERGAHIEVRALDGPVTKDQLIEVWSEVWSAAKLSYYTETGLPIRTDPEPASPFESVRKLEAAAQIKLETAVRIAMKMNPLLCVLTPEYPDHNPDGCDCAVWAEFSEAVKALGLTEEKK